MTQLSDKDHKAQMEDMKSFDEQMPCVGIFWYDADDHTLFGILKKELTPREVEEARAQGVGIIDYPTESTQVPLGRVAWNMINLLYLLASGPSRFKMSSQH